MTDFEKELEEELKKLIEVEMNTNKNIEQNENQKFLLNQKIKKLRELLLAYEDGQRRIQNRLTELNGFADLKVPLPYEKELKEIIQDAVAKEIQKEYVREFDKKERPNSRKNLVLEDAFAKRKIMKNEKIINKKNQKIKDYRDLSNVGKVSQSKSSAEGATQNKANLKNKITQLANYWNKKYQNLLFSSTAVQDVAKSFSKPDFDNLDQALSRLNNEEELERKKTSPENADYYHSFRTSSGVKSRIFYQIMTEDFGNRRIVVRRIIKQYYTRFIK